MIVLCRYCSSEIELELDKADGASCPFCGNSFWSGNADTPTTTEIYLARYKANLKRRSLEIKKDKEKLAEKRLRHLKVELVKGIKITRLRSDALYRQRLKAPLTLLEKVAKAAIIFLNNNPNHGIFYSHVDILALKCSIILKSVYVGGLLVGYHEQTDQIYIRPNRECWQKFDLGEEHEGKSP